MHLYCICIFSVLFTFPCLASGNLTEREALLSGLEHRYEIRILRLENRIDSLKVESVRARRLPQITVAAGVSGVPYDSAGMRLRDARGAGFDTGSSTTSLVTADSLSVSQYLPGGGSVAAGATFGNEAFWDGADSAVRSIAAGISVTQPLLRDAWRFGEVDYALRIARLDNKLFTLEQKKRLLSFCSDIRTRYWALYEAQSLATLYRTELAYARERTATERARFSIGLAAPLDTLSAELSLINATARLHDAQSDELQTREELAFYAGVVDSQVTIDTAAAVDCASLSPPEEMLRRVEAFDPRLRIFEVAAERLELTRAQVRNSLLPRVDVRASWSRSTVKTHPSEPEEFYGNAVIGLIASYAFPLKPRRLELAGAAASLEKNRLERENYREEVRLRLRELNRSWERERRAIEIALAAREIAGQTLAASREGFKAGTVDRLSLDKAENDFRSASVDLLRKRLLMKRLEIVFDEMTGATLSRCGVEMQ